MSSTLPAANPDLTTTFDIPSPDALASNLHADATDFVAQLGMTFVDGSFSVANDAGITNGATVGNFTMLAMLVLVVAPATAG